jgi:hypothetical protein
MAGNLGLRTHLNLKQKLNLIIFLLTGFFILNCAGANYQSHAKVQNVDFLIEQGKLNWEQRSDSLALKKAEHFISLAIQQRPSNFELAVLYSKILYTRGLFVEKDASKQDALFLLASEHCKNAVLTHPDFSSVYERAQGDSSFKLLTALSDAPSSVVPGLFWWATNLARYLNSKPVIERLNHRELVEVMMHRTLSLEPGFHYSGPYRFFGSLYTRIPGIELSQSETYFIQALSNNPEYLGNAVHMAEFYHQKAGNREQFHSLLQKVIKTDLTSYPEMMAENLFYQDRAQFLLSRETSLFE